MVGFLAVVAAATAVAIVMMWPDFSRQPAVSAQFEQVAAHTRVQVDGTVTATRPGPCSHPAAGTIVDQVPADPPGATDCTVAIVELTEGAHAGKNTLIVTTGGLGEPDLAEGQEISLYEAADANGQVTYSFADYQRDTVLIVWGIIVTAAIVAVGGMRGLRSLVGLTVTLLAVFGYLVPALLRGGDPLRLSLVVGSAVLFFVIYLVHGFSWKSTSALSGTLLAMGLAALAGRYAIDSSHLRGLGSEDNLLIQIYLPELTITGLMLCGFVIGALGGLNDVTVAQASTVNELAELDPTASRWTLFARAMKVGQDHVASMVYTLVLSYTSAALPLLLVLSISGRTLRSILTSDIMATELLRSGVGAVGLALSIPVTTVIAAYVTPRRREATQRG
ncbi:putative multitransmembrane protein [Corynebacterium uterequi]|uniref:Putative multitransmembrane protein n=1 Tax=Corynebacterium uterequi TaxID=1072256 RepID=A0A0G3HBR0_9CORY|nr:putative multitransmembrane protein [Corynebacterium uterequi]